MGRENQNRGRATAKQQQRNPAEEMVCPICLELPFDPVMAEDGRVYEKSAIEEYFAGKDGEDQVKSPYTNEMMGKKLLPAIQHRNTIEILIENGVITGDLAKKWQEKAKKGKELEEMVKKAEAGDSRAAMELGNLYYHGESGYVEQDMKTALNWYKKVRECGDAEATAWATAAMGEILARGLGNAAKNELLGVYYLTTVARKSSLAAFVLAKGFFHGRHGLPIDKAEAGRWLELVVDGTCTYGHLYEFSLIEEAKKMYADLQNQASEGSE